MFRPAAPSEKIEHHVEAVMADPVEVLEHWARETPEPADADGGTSARSCPDDRRSGRVLDEAAPRPVRFVIRTERAGTAGSLRVASGHVLAAGRRPVRRRKARR